MISSRVLSLLYLDELGLLILSISDSETNLGQWRRVLDSFTHRRGSHLDDRDLPVRNELKFLYVAITRYFSVDGCHARPTDQCVGQGTTYG
jgi:hypothetical protein